MKQGTNTQPEKTANTVGDKKIIPYENKEAVNWFFDLPEDNRKDLIEIYFPQRGTLTAREIESIYLEEAIVKNNTVREWEIGYEENAGWSITGKDGKWLFHDSDESGLSYEERKEVAARIVECWNGYDGLKKEINDEQTIRISAEVALEIIEKERNELRKANRELLEALSKLHEAALTGDQSKIITIAQIYSGEAITKHTKP